MSAANDRLVWIDCEMTGLDLATDELVEVAVVITDYELRPVDPGFAVVIRPSDAARAGMNSFVTAMHTDSGLLDELDGGLERAEAERLVLEYIGRFVPEAGKAPIAGNTIGTDRGFIQAQMPALDAHLHYRSVDVSSVKELAKRWYPRAFYQSPTKEGGHRALADIRDSIRELAYYRSIVFVPAPGPTSDEAKAASESAVSAYGSWM